ncbi:hypothetical protein Aperf_G00000033820 [Anoplocephala perfoliata]
MSDTSGDPVSEKEEEASPLDAFTSFLRCVQSMGVSNGVVEYLLLRLSSYIMKQVGMAPGGEFRAAVQMLSLQVHRHLILGDRPIGITLQRAMDSPEEIEAMKKEDLIEQLVKSLTSEYPELTRTILEERDLYLARSIWEVCGLPLESDGQGANSAVHEEPAEDANDEDDEVTLVRQRMRETAVQKPSSALMSCCPMWPSMGLLPRVVVAVVGIGHVAGIKKAWSQAPFIDKRELCQVKPKSRSWVVFRWASRGLLLTVLGFAAYYISYSTFRISRYLIRGSANLFSEYILS